MISAIEMIFEKDLRDRLEISAKSGVGDGQYVYVQAAY